MNSPPPSLLFFFILGLCFSFLFSQTNSLSTVSISTTNQALLICAINLKSYLNCTSFPNTTGAAAIQIFTPPHHHTYSSIVGGNGFLCAQQSSSPNSSVAVMGCWRFSSSSGSNPVVSYKRIHRGPPVDNLEAGSSHVCGIVRDTGRPWCWQWKNFTNSIVTQLPKTNFSSVAVGDDSLYVLDESGQVIRVRDNASVISQTQSYRVIEAGSSFACGLTTSNGSLNCWGDHAVKVPTEGQFTSLALGDRSRACAIRADNETITCWGGEDGESFSLPDDLEGTSFVAIQAKGSVFCGIVASNYSLVCWGGSEFPKGKSLLIFDNVLPGPCSRSQQCSCGLLDGSGDFCPNGQAICNSCRPSSDNSPEETHNNNNNTSNWNTKMVVLLVVGITGSISFLVSAAVCFFVLRHSKSGGSSRVHDSGRLDDIEEAANNSQGQGQGRNRGGDQRHQSAASAPPTLVKRLSHIASMGVLEEFPLQILLEITNNFSDDHKIGYGSFGSVYKAVLEDGRQIAIKRAELTVPASTMDKLLKRNEDRDMAFLAELESLSHLNHKNLVRLLGFYEDNSERILVYEYMNQGTLHDHLHNKFNSTSSTSPSSSSYTSPLTTWQGRIKVALDSARGIEYLHNYAVPPVIHRDIKSSNILLDDSWTAKVSDFGLSMMGPSGEETHISLLAAGTLGYIDPEYYRRHQLTTKSDVYSFGVVLLELLTGNKAIHLNEDGMPRNIVDFVTPFITRDEIHRVLDRNVPPPTPFEIEAVAYVGYVAAECVSLQSRARPSMAEVVGCLETAWRMVRSAPSGAGYVSSSTGSST